MLHALKELEVRVYKSVVDNYNVSDRRRCRGCVPVTPGKSDMHILRLLMISQ